MQRWSKIPPTSAPVCVSKLGGEIQPAPGTGHGVAADAEGERLNVKSASGADREALAEFCALVHG